MLSDKPIGHKPLPNDECFSCIISVEDRDSSIFENNAALSLWRNLMKYGFLQKIGGDGGSEDLYRLRILRP